MKTITLKPVNKDALRDIGGGTKIYFCPWNDFKSTNFWTTYSHAVACAYKHGLFSVPLTMIRVGMGLGR